MAAPRVLIVGGGIGGLSSAIALRDAGIQATVLERATDVQAIQVGAGLALWSNAVRALHLLGLHDEIRAVSSPLERMVPRTSEGDVVADWAVGEVGQKHGFPPVGVSRPELHRVLLDGVGEGVLELGSEYVDHEESPSGVAVSLADGRTVEGDVLVGADGVRSLLRRRLHGPTEPRYSGQTSWRGIVEQPTRHEVPAAFQLFMGANALFALYKVGGGRPYWLAASRTEAGGHDPAGRRQEAVLDRFRGWSDEVTSAVEATKEDAINRTDIVDHVPLKRWGEGRVTLLGDSAHAMTLHLGQGAGSTLEDSVVLARCLRENADPVEALRAYERRRIPRTTKFVTSSLRAASVYTSPNRLTTAVRNTLLGLLPAPAMERREKKMLDFV